MTGPPVRRVLVFGDGWGVPQVVDATPRDVLCGLVAAEIRPQYLPELEALAARLHVPLVVQVRPASPGYAAFVERVTRLAPELIVVCSYAMLLREEILALPAAGAVNVHGALLPQYRGCNPIQWALLNNEVETGVTMHYMTADVDAGDIIAQRRVPIGLEDTWREIRDRLGAATGALLAEEMPRLLRRANDRRPQDEGAARCYRRRKPEDGEIDWQRRVIDIYNLVRALVSPHPGAFCRVDGEPRRFAEYLTLQDVTRLKLGPPGGRALASARVRLDPTAPGRADHREPAAGLDGAPGQVVAFRARRSGDGRGLGAVVLGSFDYRGGLCALSVRADDGAAAGDIAEAVRLALEFAARELGLQRVSLRILDSGVEAGEVLQGIGEPWEELSREEDAVVLLSRG